MKIYIFVGLIFITFGAFIFIVQQRLNTEEIIIKTLPKVHSYLALEPYKTFEVDFIISESETIYTKADAYEQVSIKHDQTITNLEFISLEKRGQTTLNDKAMYQYILELKIPVFSDGMNIECDSASLNIGLTNNQQLNIPLGSFSYLAMEYEESALSLKHLHNTTQSYDYGVTSSGMLIKLQNNYNDLMTIDSIDILSDQIIIDQRLITPTDSEFSQSLLIDEIIDDSRPQYPSINPKESAQFALRFENAATNILYRYPIEVEYSINDKQFSYRLEDFKFINTNPYVKDNIDLFEEVVILDRD